MDQLSDTTCPPFPRTARRAHAAAAGAGNGRAPRASPGATGTGPVPLSFAQQRLWFVQQLDPANTAYNMVARHAAGRRRWTRTPCSRALDAVVERHEALRTVVRPGGRRARAGGGARDAHRAARWRTWTALDEAERDGRRSAARARARRARPFDLAHGPLLRAVLLRLAAERHVLLLTMHHVISDGWSRGVHRPRDLGGVHGVRAGRRRRALPALPVQYPDYAAWQRERHAGRAAGRAAGLLARQLAGAPPALELPDGPPAPRRAVVRRAPSHRFALPAGSRRRCARWRGRRAPRCSWCCWRRSQPLLARYTGQADVVVGTPVANRGRRGDGGAGRLLRQHAGAAHRPVGRPHLPRGAAPRARHRPGGVRARGAAVRAAGGGAARRSAA